MHLAVVDVIVVDHDAELVHAAVAAVVGVRREKWVMADAQQADGHVARYVDDTGGVGDAVERKGRLGISSVSFVQGANGNWHGTMTRVYHHLPKMLNAEPQKRRRNKNRQKHTRNRNMQTTPLGATGVDVSIYCWGAMYFGSRTTASC